MTQTLTNGISEALKELAKTKARYQLAQEELTRCEKLSQDYLHILELGELKYHDRAKLGELLRQCRLERRYAKDALQCYQPVVDFLESEKGKLAVGQFQQLLGNVRKAEQQMKNRSYSPRILSDQEYQAYLE